MPSPTGGYRIYKNVWGSTQPSSELAGNAAQFIGVRFRPTVDIYILGARFFRDLADDGTHFAEVGLSAIPFTPKTMVKFYNRVAAPAGPDGWQSAYFRPRFAVSSGTLVSLRVHFAKNFIFYTPGLLASADYTVGDLTFPQNTASFFNPAYTFSLDLVLNNSNGGALFGIDPIYVRQKP